MNPQPRQTKQDERTPYNAGDAQQVDERKRQAKDIERRRIAGLKAIVDHPDARLWLWGLLSFCGIARSSFTGNSETFFREGQRNVGLRIQAELTEHHPDKYIDMLKEGAKNAT